MDEPDPAQPTPPGDPLTALAEMAASIHEMFLAFKSSGFTVAQSMYLVGQVVRGMSDSARNETPDQDAG